MFRINKLASQANQIFKLSGKRTNGFALGQWQVLKDNTQIISYLFSTPKFSFARVGRQSGGSKLKSVDQNELNDEENQQNIEAHTKEQENVAQFEYSAETFISILEAIESSGKSLIEVIRSSDLKEKISANQPQNKEAFINCLRVCERCQILDNEFRDKLYLQLKQGELYNASYSNAEIGVIVQYFLMKPDHKKYYIELESFLIKRIDQMGEKHIREVMDIYCNNFKGSIEFYAAIQNKLLSLIQKSSGEQQTKSKGIPFNILMEKYLCAFTKSNYYTKEMEEYMIKIIEERLLSQQYQAYFAETVLPYIDQILFFFALKFESTKHLHETLLVQIENNHHKDKQLHQRLSKPLNLFLRVYQLFSGKQINDFFLPALRYKNEHIETSLVQEQIRPYLLKFIPKIHLKENFSIDSFNVDYYAFIDNQKLVIEVNGRYHYYHNRYACIYHLKRTCLEKQGYTILEIKDYTWNALKEEEKLPFISNLLSPYLKSAKNFIQQKEQQK